MKMMRVIRSLAADCRDQGDKEMAECFTQLGDDVQELCAAIVSERKASDSGDSIAYLEARLRTTQSLVKFAALAQQPAAVDEGAVFRLAVWMAKNEGHDDPHHLIWEGSPPEPWGEVWNRYEDDARAALTAALATQHQEPTT